jgi:hypothetical protein
MTKKSSSKSAGKFKVSGGKSGGMHNFAGASAQKPGVSATTSTKGKGAPFAKGGPSGKMHGFEGVKPVKKA